MSDRKFSRRRFLLRASAAAVGASLAGFTWTRAATPSPAARKPRYAFVVLGDLHYDRMTHHDLDWVGKEKGNGDIHQIEGYCKSTEQHLPQLMKRVKQVIASRGVEIPFVIQVGDFVEGLCGSHELATQQCNDAIAMVDQS